MLGACVGALAASARLVAAVGGRAEVEDTAQLAAEAFRFDARRAGFDPAASGLEALAGALPDQLTLQADLDADGVVDTASEEVTRWLCATGPPRLSRIIGAQSLPVAAPVSRCELHYLDAAGGELPAAGGLDAASRARVRRDRARVRRRSGFRRRRRQPDRRSGGTEGAMTRAWRHARGAALPAALVVVAVAAAVSAALGALAQSELLLARGREASARALAAADACAADVVADLPAGWEFDPLIAGADGVAGTPDDGERTAPSGCAAVLRTAPGPVQPPRALVDVEAVAGTGRRIVEAVVARAAGPGTPALIWVADPASLRDPGGTLALDGADVARPAAGALAPIAAPGDPGDARRLDRGARGEGHRDAGRCRGAQRSAAARRGAGDPDAGRWRGLDRHPGPGGLATARAHAGHGRSRDRQHGARPRAAAGRRAPRHHRDVRV